MLNWAATLLFVVMVSLMIRRIGKERPIRMRTPLISILIGFLFLLGYWIITASEPPPLLFLLGVAVGLFKGNLNEIRRREGIVVCKRTQAFLLFWALMFVANQFLLSAGVWKGLMLTTFSTGGVVGSNGNIAYQLWRLG
jgi:hypothetical protein